MITIIIFDAIGSVLFGRPPPKVLGSFARPLAAP